MELLLYALNGNFGPGGITAAALVIILAVMFVLWALDAIRIVVSKK